MGKKSDECPDLVCHAGFFGTGMCKINGVFFNAYYMEFLHLIDKKATRLPTEKTENGGYEVVPIAPAKELLAEIASADPFGVSDESAYGITDESVRTINRLLKGKYSEISFAVLLFFVTSAREHNLTDFPYEALARIASSKEPLYVKAEQARKLSLVKDSKFANWVASYQNP